MGANNNGNGKGEIDLNVSINELAVSTPKYVIDQSTIGEAIKIMKQFKIGSILVVDESVKLVGIMTERDILMKFVNTNLTTEDSIDCIMTKNPTSFSNKKTTVSQVIQAMHTGRYRHVPIINEQGIPVGIISIKDVFQFFYNGLLNDKLS